MQKSPPFHFYAILISLEVCLIGLIWNQWVVAAVGACLWAALTLRFAIKRLKGASHTPSHIAEMLATSVALPILSIYWRLYGAVKFHTRFL